MVGSSVRANTGSLLPGSTINTKAISVNSHTSLLVFSSVFGVAATVA